MKAIEDAKLNSFNELEQLVANEEARFAVIPAFKNSFKEVTNRLTEIKLLMQFANDNTVIITGSKDQLQQKLCEATAIMAAPVSAYADSIGDVELQALMNATVPGLLAIKKDRLEAECQKIYDKAVELKTQAAEYNLTPDMLKEVEQLLKEWKVKMTATALKQAEITKALKNISRLAKEIDGLLKRRLDKMVMTLKKSDPDLFGLWESARKVKKPQTTPTQVLVTVKMKETDSPKSDANIVLSNGKDFPAKTNNEGEALYKPIKFGKFILKVDAEGCVPILIKDYRVFKGKVNRVDVMLESA